MSTQKPLKMYNLNVNVATALNGTGGLFGALAEQLISTPRTPEIVNSLMAMGNPFDNFGKAGQENASPSSIETSSSIGSPTGSPTTTPPSVQHTCSQLIKEGLKLTLQSKRKLSISESRDDFDDCQIKRTKTEELTEEDEERRKRRRERNKIAATKCRMKKRERTINLVSESEELEKQNIELKTQIEDLEKQKQRLSSMLAQHAPHCTRNQHLIIAQSTPNQGYDIFAGENYVDPEFNDSTGLLSYSKDPNFGKFMDNMYPQGKNIRTKWDGVYRGNYKCEEEDPDVYRPNGLIDNTFFGNNDSGYSSFSSSQMDPGCRA